MILPLKYDCMFCYSTKTKKYGIGKSGGQRYKCNDCKHTFSIGGTRGTYAIIFKNSVIENYCHRSKKALEVINHYGISSRTLIKRSKEHKKNCEDCKK